VTTKTATGAALHLVVGDEEFLVERAVSSVIAEVRAAGEVPDEVPIDPMRRGDPTARVGQTRAHAPQPMQAS